MDILIFKTNISTRKRLKLAEKIFETQEGIIKWNVDVTDIDHVLRVEADNVAPNQIEVALANAGYYCEELRD